MADITVTIRTVSPWRADGAGPALCLRLAFTPGGALCELPLRTGVTELGREPSGAAGHRLVLDDPCVSRNHATLTLRGDGELRLADCNSRNGVSVNGVRVERQALAAGDVLRIGDSVLLVCAAARADEADALGLVGRAPVMAELRTAIRRVGPSDLPVVIMGATGTGKELVARALHAESGRQGSFLALNCATLPGALVENALFGHKRGAYTDATSDQDGAFVQARGGTLFLDEIGDLALEAQPKLLRALENREVTPIGATAPLNVDVRIVVATHVPLEAAMREGRFREDLFARLAGVTLKVPTLAERREDILPLLARFLPSGFGDRALTADFVESLLTYAWPRNVRELQKLAERLPVLHPDAAAWTRAMLDDEMRAGAPPSRPVLDAPAAECGPPTRDELLVLLERCAGNVTRLARLTGRSRKQVYRWMDQHNVARGTGRTWPQ